MMCDKETTLCSVRKEQQTTVTCFLFLPPDIQMTAAGRRKSSANHQGNIVKGRRAGTSGWCQCPISRFSLDYIRFSDYWMGSTSNMTELVWLLQEQEVIRQVSVDRRALLDPIWRTSTEVSLSSWSQMLKSFWDEEWTKEWWRWWWKTFCTFWKFPPMCVKGRKCQTVKIKGEECLTVKVQVSHIEDFQSSEGENLLNISETFWGFKFKQSVWNEMSWNHSILDSF